MNVTACILLIIFAALLMGLFGIGPFAKKPWEYVHFKLLQLPPFLQRCLKYLSVLIIALATLTLTGIIQ